MLYVANPPNFSGTGYITGVEAPSSGNIDGSNKVFTFSHTPKDIVSDGVTYFENNGYTRVSLTITMDIAPVGYIRSEY